MYIYIYMSQLCSAWGFHCLSIYIYIHIWANFAQPEACIASDAKKDRCLEQMFSEQILWNRFSGTDSLQQIFWNLNYNCEVSSNCLEPWPKCSISNTSHVAVGVGAAPGALVVVLPAVPAIPRDWTRPFKQRLGAWAKSFRIGQSEPALLSLRPLASAAHDPWWKFGVLTCGIFCFWI